MKTAIEHRAWRITLPRRLPRAGDFSAGLGDVQSFAFGVTRAGEEDGEVESNA